MDLKQLAAKPQLIKITLDDAEIIEEFKEPLDFYTWDRQPLDVFLKLSNQLGVDQGGSIETIKSLILDSEGRQVMTDELVIPVRVMVKAMGRIMDILGK
jgi:hypothetical protein